MSQLIVTTPTFYSNKEDIRYSLALETCREAARCRVRLIVVDASPLEEVRKELSACGRANDGSEFVRVAKQTYKGKKGAALREGIALALEELKGSSEGIIAFQEPEKVKMMEHWEQVAAHMADSDVCVPKRTSSSFLASYPIEQYHSEHFANHHLDALGKRVGFPSIDWTMGPFALRSKLANVWLDYQGELWDAQLVPIVLSQRWHGAKITTYEFDYMQPESMKEEEEGNPIWTEKRLVQLSCLFEYVGGALKSETKP